MATAAIFKKWTKS